MNPEEMEQDEKSTCDGCANNHQDFNKKPCSICMQFVDGYLQATRYEPFRG